MNILSDSERNDAHVRIIALVQQYVTGTHGDITHKVREYVIGAGAHRRKASEVAFIAPFDIDGAVHWVAFEAYLDGELRITTETLAHHQLRTKRKHVESAASFMAGDAVLAKLRGLASDERLPFSMRITLRQSITEMRARASLGLCARAADAA